MSEQEPKLTAKEMLKEALGEISKIGGRVSTFGMGRINGKLVEDLTEEEAEKFVKGFAKASDAFMSLTDSSSSK